MSKGKEISDDNLIEATIEEMKQRGFYLQKRGERAAKSFETREKELEAHAELTERITAVLEKLNQNEDDLTTTADENNKDNTTKI